MLELSANGVSPARCPHDRHCRLQGPVLFLTGWLLACQPGTHGHSTGSRDTDSAPRDSAPPEDSAPLDDGERISHVQDLHADLHDEVATILVVRWTQTRDAPVTQIEYRVDGGAWSRTRPRIAPAGARSVPLLGLPPDTPVSYRVVERSPLSSQAIRSEVLHARTGLLPKEIPLPTLTSWDPSRTGPERWLLATIDTGKEQFQGPWWVVILDRLGRVVWYRRVPDDLVALTSRVAPDGTHITWSEARWAGTSGSEGIVRASLDLACEERIELQDMVRTYDELPDGTIAYDAVNANGFTLRTLDPSGVQTDLWSCVDWLPPGYEMWTCGSNTVHYSADRGTYLWSMFQLDTLLEVDPELGIVRASWGSLGENEVQPSGTSFIMPHQPAWTSEGTLMLATQGEEGEAVQWAREFSVDAATSALDVVWQYGATDRFASCAGEAARLPNGNTLINYGCDGAIREITPENEVVWDLLYEARIGRQTLIRDLEALTGDCNPQRVRRFSIEDALHRGP